MTDLRQDMIYQQAFQAAKISYVVNMVSTSYVKVSEKHITSRIAGKLQMPQKTSHEPFSPNS